MNRSIVTKLAVVFIVIMLVLSACAQKATPIPAVADSQSGSTKHTLGYGSNLMVTFSAGDQCSLEGAKSVQAGPLQYEIYVDAQDHPIYWLALVTLDEGKGLPDLQAIPAEDISQPDFAQLIVANFETRGSHSTLLLNVDKGPLYFACFAGDRYGIGRKIGALGPVEVEQ